MKRGWIIVLIVVFILLLGGLAYLFYKKKRDANDNEADLDLVNKAINQVGEESAALQAISEARAAGRISSATAQTYLQEVKKNPGQVLNLLQPESGTTNGTGMRVQRNLNVVAQPNKIIGQKQVNSHIDTNIERNTTPSNATAPSASRNALASANSTAVLSLLG